MKAAAIALSAVLGRPRIYVGETLALGPGKSAGSRDYVGIVPGHRLWAQIKSVALLR